MQLRKSWKKESKKKILNRTDHIIKIFKGVFFIHYSVLNKKNEEDKRNEKILEIEKLVERELNKPINEFGETDFSVISHPKFTLEFPLPEEFIRKYRNRLNWTFISGMKTLTIEFLVEHDDFLKWDLINYKRAFPDWFIQKYKDKLSWEYISYDQSLSLQQVEKFKNYVSWYTVSYRYNLDKEFIKRNIDNIDLKSLYEDNEVVDDSVKEFVKDLLDIQKLFL